MQIPAFAVDPAPRQEKKLRIQYEVLTEQYSPASNSITITVVRQGTKTVSMATAGAAAAAAAAGSANEAEKKTTIIRPDPSFFDRIVEVSRVTLDMEGDGTLPTDFVLDSFRMAKLADSFYPLIRNSGEEAVEFKSKVTSVMVPDLGARVAGDYAFAVGFWLFPSAVPTSGPAGGTRNVVRKGNGQDSGFLVALGANDNKVTFTVRSRDMANSSQPLTTRKDLPVRQWSHVACVCDGKKMAVYVDGALDTERVLQSSAYGNSDPFIIGRVPLGLPTMAGKAVARSKDSQFDGFDGSVKDMRFYMVPPTPDTLSK